MTTHDKAACPECNGTGSVRQLLGPDEVLAECPSCGGMAYELTRDDFLNLDALKDERDLRLVPDSEPKPTFHSHADEIRWMMQRYGKAS